MNNPFQASIRNIKNKPVYAIFTFIGFTIGIMVTILLYIWVSNELSYDKFHPDYNRIYRVLTLSRQNDVIEKSAKGYEAVAQTLKSDYPQIEAAAYISYSSEDVPLKREDNTRFIEARESGISIDFFKIFQGFKFVEGSPENIFDNPNNIVISQKIAEKFFGEAPALGKTLINDKYGKIVYTIAAVVDIPIQSHLDFDFAKPSIQNMYWGDAWWTRVYVKLSEHADVSDEFNQKLSNHISNYSPIKDKLLFQPLSDIHLCSDYSDPLTKNLSNYKYVWIFSIMAFLILFMASFNFSMFSIARASERAKEIGIKKVNGATRNQIITQFMGETLFQIVCAMIIAILLLIISIPLINNYLGISITIPFSFKSIMTLLIFTSVVTILSGFFPAWFLSSLNPVSIFKGNNNRRIKTAFIQSLVIVQFSIAIFFIVVTFLLIKQLNFIQHKDLGLARNDIVVIPTGLWYDNKPFKEELLRNPNIKAVSASVYAPVDYFYKTSLPMASLGKTDSLEISLIMADQDFADTYQLKLIKGQFLQMDTEAYWKEKDKKRQAEERDKYMVSIPVVINETAEKRIGIPNVVGKRIGDNIIVGVVKDFHYRPLHFPIEPVMITNDPENIMTMSVRIAPKNRSETLKYIKTVYQKHRDNREMSYRFFDEMISEKYQDENRLKKISISLAVLSLIISVLGILGMAIYSINRRVKEIGIRKVNGARTSEVMAMLNKDFVIWVAIAFVIATPIAYYTMNKWLQNFAYKTELSWWIFALAGLMALGIALLTVSWQSWRAATRNPVEALRNE